MTVMGHPFNGLVLGLIDMFSVNKVKGLVQYHVNDARITSTKVIVIL